MSLLKAWAIVSAVALGAVLVWSFVPILIPMVVIGAGLAGIAAGMVALARAIERRRQ